MDALNENGNFERPPHLAEARHALTAFAADKPPEVQHQAKMVCVQLLLAEMFPHCAALRGVIDDGLRLIAAQAKGAE